MKKKFYILILSCCFLHFVNAQEKKYALGNNWGASLFQSVYDVPGGFGVQSGDTVRAVNLYFNQLFVIPIKKRAFVTTGVGLNWYQAGISNGRKVLKILEIIPSVGYTPTYTDSVSIMVKARYKNLYVAIPLSFRYVLPIDASLGIYVELGIENEFLLRSKTNLAIREGTWSIFDGYDTLSDGPVVDFYDKQVNRYAANVFGIIGLDIKIYKDMNFALTLGYQKSVIERNRFLAETQGISLGFKYQYFITR